MKKVFSNQKIKWTVILCCVLLVLPMLVVSAGSSYLYTDFGTLEAIEAPEAAVPTRVLDGTDIGSGALKSPQDLCVDKNGRMYIADSGNNRILILNKDYTMEREIREFSFNGKTEQFLNPQGVFVTHKGEIFVADTENKRVVVFSASGECVQIMAEPNSRLLPESFNYQPTKVAVDINDRIFVVSRGFNMGLIELKQDGSFARIAGSSKVSYTLTELFLRLISTKAMRDRMTSFVSVEYNNAVFDEGGFLYVTAGNASSGESTPIRRLNASDSDILKRTSRDIVGDLMTSNKSSIKGPSLFVDVALMPHDMYAAIDQKRGRVFVYSHEGKNLAIFGSIGNSTGTFKIPTAISYQDQNFVILDAGTGEINFYTLTDYGKALIETQKYKKINDFDAEKVAWQELLKFDESNTVVFNTLGDIAYKERDMDTAMNYYRLTGNFEGYSEAYTQVRQDWIANNFTPMMIIVLVLLFALAVVKALKRKGIIKTKPAGIVKQQCQNVGYVMLHPFKGFWELKRENLGRMSVAHILLVIACIATVMQSRFISYHFQTQAVQETGVIMDLVKVLGPFLLWILANWCVTSLMDGEGNFRQIYMASAYSLAPVAILIPISVVLTHFLTLSEKEIVVVISVLAYVWLAALLVSSVMQTHNYSMGRTLFIVLIILLVIVLVLFIGLMGFSLVQQMQVFVTDTINELSLRF